ncbi:MAG: hypothetical protein HY888_01825, partial [Deltaproteobacteria bacterium]|nr:hypothetical protein [Deltaproteobacteria bacterium]
MNSSNKIICLCTAILMGLAGVGIVLKVRPAVAAAANCGCHPQKVELKFVHQPVKDGEC